MKTWESEIYKDNHIKLKSFHRAISIIYFLLSVIIFILMGINGFFIEATCIFMCILHCSLAIGSNKKIELSRKLSELMGALMLLAFPIGTIIGYLLLQRTIWAEPIEENYNP